MSDRIVWKHADLNAPWYLEILRQIKGNQGNSISFGQHILEMHEESCCTHLNYCVCDAFVNRLRYRVNETGSCELLVLNYNIDVFVVDFNQLLCSLLVMCIFVS